VAIDFEIVEHQPVAGPNLTRVKVEFRPIPGGPVHSNIFHMQLYPTGTRLIITALGQLITESGILVPPLPAPAIQNFPDENPADPYQRETFARDNNAEMVANIEAYWERKIKAAAEGHPYPQHHQSTLNLQVGVGLDDAKELDNDTTFDNDSVIVRASSDTGASLRWNSGFRFTNVTIAQGDTIDAATMQVKPTSVFADDANTDIFANDVDNAANFSDEADVTSRTLTAASTSWVENTLGTDFVTTPSILSVIQEIVDRASWASGNALVTMIRGKADIQKSLTLFSYDNSSADAPKLDIDFTAGAAFPQVEDTGISSSSANETSHIVDIPLNIVAGNLLIVCFTSDGDAGGVSWPAGWTEFFETVNGSAVTLALAYRQADGGEGATITVTTGNAERSAHCSYRISGHEDPTIRGPEATTNATGLNDSPNPPVVTPVGGATDYLWLAVHGSDGPLTTTAFPTNYINGISVGAAGGEGCAVGAAERDLNASSEDPGVFTISASEEWVAATIAIYPPGTSILQTKVALLESLVPISQTKPITLEGLRSIAQMKALSVEALALIPQTGIFTLESVVPASARVASPLESLATLVRLGVIPQESLQSLTQTKTVPVETLALLVQTKLLPVESLVLSQATMVAPIESVAEAVTKLAIAPFESLILLGVTPPIPLEALAPIQVGVTSPLESLIRAVQTKSTPLEATTLVVQSKVIPIESRANVITSLAVVPLEALSSGLLSRGVDFIGTDWSAPTRVSSHSHPDQRIVD